MGGRKGGREGHSTVCPWFHGLQGGWKDWSGEGLLGWVWRPCGPCLPALLKYSPWGLVGQLAAHQVSSKGERLLLQDGPEGCTTTSHQGTKPGPGHQSIQTPSQSGSQRLKEMENFPSGVTNLSSERQHEAHSPTWGFTLDHRPVLRYTERLLLPEAPMMPCSLCPVCFGPHHLLRRVFCDFFT